MLRHVEPRHLDLDLPFINLVNNLNQTEANQIVEGDFLIVSRRNALLPLPLLNGFNPPCNTRGFLQVAVIVELV